MHLHKPSPAIMIACLALFVALGGTAIAASRYVITSTSQIMPSVRSALAVAGPDAQLFSKEVSVQPGRFGVSNANCLAGEHVVTGGYTDNLAPGAFIARDTSRGTHGWSVTVDNEHGSGVSSVGAEVLCAPGSIVTEGGKAPSGG